VFAQTPLADVYDGTKEPVLPNVPKTISLVLFLCRPEAVGILGIEWHSEQAVLAAITDAFKCFTWAPTLESLVAVAPASDLKGLVVEIL
jgi:hypothetical protein